jgi:hypothetical protein
MHELVINKTKGLVQELGPFPFVWWSNNMWSTVLNFHPCICGWRLAKTLVVVILAIVLFSDLTKKFMVRKLITYGFNGLNVFHNLKIGVTM